ncbi:MAG: crossover junction endodeoxyribonuclease RuvC [Dehalococcoidia bacterium]|nr:crossover junction endodeoxyribonuclease RuvC [Dehalococcoidia bacterium]
MIVIGVDPGLITTGYGVIEEHRGKFRLLEGGTIEGGPADRPIQGRLLALYRGMEDVLKELRPQVMAVEALYSHYAHPATAILMGHARGVLCLAGAQLDIPIFHYTATQIKEYLVGSGRASKTQIQLMVQKELGLDDVPNPNDVADALAVALCHCRLASSPLVQVLHSARLRPQSEEAKA